MMDYSALMVRGALLMQPVQSDGKIAASDFIKLQSSRSLAIDCNPFDCVLFLASYYISIPFP